MQERQLDVNIPKGVREGQHLRLAGQGTPGIGSGPAGDLYLEIAFRPHPRFRIDGRDMYVDLPVAPWEAALGASVPVPTPEGQVQTDDPGRHGARAQAAAARPRSAGQAARRPVRRHRRSRCRRPTCPVRRLPTGAGRGFPRLRPPSFIGGLKNMAVAIPASHSRRDRRRGGDRIHLGSTCAAPAAPSATTCSNWSTKGCSSRPARAPRRMALQRPVAPHRAGCAAAAARASSSARLERRWCWTCSTRSIRCAHACAAPGCAELRTPGR